MSLFNNFSFAGKKALIRVDFNVPLNDKFEITDETRIKAVIPTVKKILSDGGSVILMSHLGRPKDGPEEKFSLKHIVSRLSEVFSTSILPWINLEASSHDKIISQIKRCPSGALSFKHKISA